jgi:hypothetical protein
LQIDETELFFAVCEYMRHVELGLSSIASTGKSSAQPKKFSTRGTMAFSRTATLTIRTNVPGGHLETKIRVTFRCSFRKLLKFGLESIAAILIDAVLFGGFSLLHAAVKLAWDLSKAVSVEFHQSTEFIADFYRSD